jgi:hypothetical protein
MFDIKDLLDIPGKISALVNTTRGALLGQPDEAAEKMAWVLDEIAKIYVFIESETVNYLSLVFLADGTNLIQGRRALLALESGALEIKGHEARGHCHKIHNVYEKYLRRWFKEVLSSQEADQMRQIFDLLGNMDDFMVGALQKVSAWLTSEAEATLNEVEAGNYPAANSRIRDARQQTLQVRRELTRALGQLRALQAEFIAASKTV